MSVLILTRDRVETFLVAHIRTWGLVSVIALSAAILIVLLIAIFVWNRTLRIRVEQKTADLERKAAEIRELNEQLRISNEELQTSNEEYESANEELQLLNDDLNERNARLAEAAEQMRALKDFSEKVIAAVPSALIVVDRHLKILSANNNYYSTFPRVPDKVEGAFLSDALPPSLLYDYDIVRKMQEVVQTSAPIRIPAASYTDDDQVEHFLDVYLCPLASELKGDGKAANVLLVIDDITRMKSLENEIVARERYLSNLVTNSIVAVMAADRNVHFTLFNEGAERLLSVSSEEMLGVPVRKIFAREEDFRKILERIGWREKVEDHESEFLTREGHKIEVILFATSLQNEKGELTGYLFIGIDVRERKRVERNLIRTNKELSTLYAVGRTLSSSTPIDERLQQVVEQVTAAFGCQVGALALFDPSDMFRSERVCAVGSQHLTSEESLHEVVGIITDRLRAEQKPILTMTLGDDLHVLRRFKSAPDNGSLMGVPLCCPGTKMIGSLSAVKADGPPFDSHDLDLLSSLGRQIAVAVENEELYARQKENVSRLRALVNATRLVGSVLNPAGVLDALPGQVMQIVPCCCSAVLRYGPETHSFSFLAVKFAGAIRGLEKEASFSADGSPIEELLKSWQPCFCSADDQRDCPVRKPFVEARVRSCLCMPVAFDGSAGLLVVGRDNRRPMADTELHIISDLLAHASLSVKNASLYTALQTAYADLKKAQDAMVKAEKYRAIGELSAGVAHDFNNALSIILGRAQHLMTVTNNKQILKGLKSIESASRDAANTVRRMQQFSRAITQRPYSRVDANEIVTQVLETIEPRRKELAELAGVHVDVVRKLQNAESISGNGGELREALTNVVFNAIEAMPQGGTLTVATGVRGNHVFIEIRDTGVGMPPEVQEKVFQPFFTTKPDGMGLGLSLVYGTVKRHGGQIEIASQPNKGTTATLLFPIDVSASEVREGTQPILTRKATILIVDDNIEVTRTLSQMLESASHQVMSVADGQEGIRRYRESEFDVVITDIGMPGISGWEVSKAIRAYDPSAKIILITAWGVQLDQGQIEQSGASLVIPKPFDKARILSAIERLLSGTPSR